MEPLSTSTKRKRFLSTLSLRRATRQRRIKLGKLRFLSTLSLRRATRNISLLDISSAFLSTLSLRRATPTRPKTHQWPDISIHALLAESDLTSSYSAKASTLFLSTLSLRRATYGRINDISRLIFLSTLSLRRATRSAAPLQGECTISIHALLAESDHGDGPDY